MVSAVEENGAGASTQLAILPIEAGVFQQSELPSILFDKGKTPGG
jgi:hypothetical protein